MDVGLFVSGLRQDFIRLETYQQATIALGLLGNVANLVIAPLWRQAVARRHKAEQERDAERQARENDRNEFRNVMRAEMMGWGARSIDAMAQAHTWLLRQSRGWPAAEDERLQLQTTISALVDLGRLYFPNHSSDLPKPEFLKRSPANRGFRDPILDALMLAYEELGRWPGEREAAGAAAVNVFRARREFVSELQDWVDPQHLGFGRYQGAAQRARKLEQDWERISALVDDFEKRFGQGTFWEDRPKAHSVLRRELIAQGLLKEGGK